MLGPDVPERRRLNDVWMCWDSFPGGRRSRGKAWVGMHSAYFGTARRPERPGKEGGERGDRDRVRLPRA